MKNLIKLVAGDARVDQNDPWILIREKQPETDGAFILPVAQWQARQHHNVFVEGQRSPDGVLLQPDDEPEALQPWLSVLPMIAIDFPSFRDGRGYSQAYLLRVRLGWKGELRAVGDVLRDQLAHMRHCGFDAFAIREDKSAEEALKGLAGMSVLYGRSAIEPRPLFRRRE
ncbi:oxidoreductase [Stutzerimonas nosocomialis]|uniref:DUF934 domain-containing protein n=1 Tax=Stutzerimonas nosocomialis TaxID=1056496 RepID=UPI001109F1E9|nr:DUF934 domain-containing protein [Stutzerimonas nosocomialis]TLX54447.1 oxidoreductase [Stutzerimonas nosocomialis]